MREANSTPEINSEAAGIVTRENPGSPLNGIKVFFLMMFLLGQLAGSPAQNTDRLLSAHKTQQERVYKYRDCHEGVHPFVRIIQKNTQPQMGFFYEFHMNHSLKPYRLFAYQEIQMKIPKGTKTAFPLQLYDNHLPYILTGDVFRTPMGDVVVFYGFTQCNVGKTAENHKKLTIAKALQETLATQSEERFHTHCFPFHDTWWTKTYSAFIHALQTNEDDGVRRWRTELAEQLNETDYNFMVWHEWQEGFTLWLENAMRKFLLLPEDSHFAQSFNPHKSFALGGSAYIHYLTEREPALMHNRNGLLLRMYTTET